MTVCILRTQSALTDSRLQRILKQYDDIGYKSIVIDMCRVGDIPASEYSYATQSIYGGRSANLIWYLKYYFHVIRTVGAIASSFTILHAIDLDTGLVGYCLSRLYKKHFIYESYDHYADSRQIRFRDLISKVEGWLLDTADIAILPDLRRLPQYGKMIRGENVIEIKNFDLLLKDKTFKKSHKLVVSEIKIVYAGILSTDRYIDKLLDELAGKYNIHLTLIGYGPLEELVRAYAQEYTNVKFLGRLTHDKLMNSLSNCDFMYACYHEDKPNHKFASPNKYFEHLYLTLPVITNSGTMFASDIIKGGSGLVFDARTTNIYDLVNGISPERYEDMKICCSEVFTKERLNNVKNIHNFKAAMKVLDV